MKGIYGFFVGTKRVRIVCGDVGRFLSECARRHIHIRNIKRCDAITVEFSVYSYNYSELVQVAKRQKSDVTLICEKSLYRWMSMYRRRKIFVFGFVIFLIAIAISSCYITDITVSGNVDISSEEIISELDKIGFRVGVFRYGLDVKNIQNSVMLNYDKLSWLWIELHGTSAHVSVRERIAKPDIEDRSDYCNSVASTDALITEIMPRYGRPVVKVGDVVRAGDLLITGIAETKTGEVRYMHADGIVKGRTWYEADGVYNHTRYDRYLTGDEQKRYSLTLGKHTYPLFAENNTSYKLYEHSKKEQKMNFFKKTLPISFTIDSYCEIIENGVEISDDEVVDTAVNVLGEKLAKSLRDKKDLMIIDKTHTYETLDNGNIYVKVRFECSEDIARYKPIEHPEYINEQEEQ